MSCCLWGEKPKVISWPHVCSKWVGAFGPLQPPSTQIIFFLVRALSTTTCAPFFPKSRNVCVSVERTAKCVCHFCQAALRRSNEKRVYVLRVCCACHWCCVWIWLSRRRFFCVCTCGSYNRYERAQRLILTIFILPVVKYELLSHSTSTTNTWTFSNVEMKSYYCIIIWSPAAVSF